MYRNYDITDIRILPMSEEIEFKGYSISDIQSKFFMDDLIYKDGEYYYRTSGMKINRQALVLFQFSNRIVATAILQEVIKKDFDETYKGKYCFDPISIGVFEPITVEKLNEIFNIKRLSQSKQNLEVSKLNQFLDLLEKKRIIYSYENNENLNEIYFSENSDLEDYEDQFEKKNDEENNSKYKQRKRSQLNKYRAIKKVNFTCEIDSSHRWFKSKKTNENYVEGHHLIPISYQNNFEYSIDIPANIISLCPLCHKKLHHAELKEKKKLIKKIYNQRKERLNKCRIDISIEELIEMYK